LNALIKHTGLLISAIILTSFCIGQGGFIEKMKIETPGNTIACDALGNLYVADDYDLKMFNSDGKLLFTYSNYLAGKITFIDPTDPFKILVYYQDFSQVEVLDNQLARATDPILLQAYGLDLATLVCRSYNSGMWVYDPQNFELIRFDQSMQPTDRTGNLNLVTGNDIDPNFITEVDNMVYLNDPQVGIIVFDKYGTYFNTYSFLNIDELQVHRGRLIFTSASMLKIYDTKTLIEAEIPLPEINTRDVKLSFDQQPPRLYTLTEDGVTIYEKID